MKTGFLTHARLKTVAIPLCLIFLLSLRAWGLEIPSLAAPATGEIIKHVRYLASDELTGRGVDTPGIQLARNYIAKEFKNYGLLPGGDNGTYFQSLEVVTGVKAKEPSTAILSGDPPLVLNQDWTPLGLSHSGVAEGEVVFVGYGITAQDYGYDDYAGIEVKGKLVLVLRYEPPPTRDNSPFHKAPRYSRHATFNAKASNARNHGAIGMILVDPNPVREGEPELISLRRTLGQNDSGLVSVQIKKQLVEKWLQRANLSLAELKQKIDREEKPASALLSGLKVSLQVNLEKTTHKTDNVIGILPGSDPKLKEQNIVIGAHYDHIGLGYFGTRDASTEGQIHNGADDNASGTAVVMKLAEDLARAVRKPARTVVFVAFTAEELGIRGSRYYVEHPPFPLGSTVAMLNFDMVGRMKNNQLTVAGMDTAREFSEWITEAGKKVGVEIQGSSPRGGSSDHSAFHAKDIPSLHFYTGIHEDYHRPTDDWDKLNFEGMVKLSDLVLNVVGKLASSPQSLKFVRPSPTATGLEPTHPYP
ncbi:MAG TPA: M20/M25/M40 family metallo-hydrolase [Candidatus Binatia bacterium]|jgi:hypothetical protein|nr:M20/M25/M40 family metallo-hydrolase [Candidatus Binatia bacterium]